MKWDSLRIDQIGTISRGKSRHRPRDAAHLYGGPYPFIQTGDVKASGLYITAYSQTYSDAGLAQSKLWPAGTLCITIAANIGDTSILSFDACFPDSVIGFVADPQKADTRFIKYLFDSKLKAQYKAFSQGVAQDNLSQEKLLSIDLTVPNISIQTRIAEILSAYDCLIENNRRQIKLLEESARLLYREWFVRLRFPGHEQVKVVDGVPEGWEWRSIGPSCSKVGSGATPKGGESAYQLTGISLIRSQNVYDDLFDFDGLAKISDEQASLLDNVTVHSNDVLLNITGASVARCCMVPPSVLPARVNQHVMIIRSKRDELSAYFLLYSLLATDNKNRLLGISRSAGATREALTKDIVADFKILIPDTSVMRRFDDAVSLLHQAKEQLHFQNQKLAAARDLLLPRLMSGELEV